MTINVEDQWDIWWPAWCVHFERQGYPTPNEALSLEMRNRFDEIMDDLKEKQQLLRIQQRHKQMSDSDRNLRINGELSIYIYKDKIGDPVVPDNQWFFVNKPNVCFCYCFISLFL